MKAAKGIGAVLSVFVVLPIWYYLLYQVLKRVGASDVMWLLYWIYLPVAAVCRAIEKIIESEST